MASNYKKNARAIQTTKPDLATQSSSPMVVVLAQRLLPTNMAVTIGAAYFQNLNQEI